MAETTNTPAPVTPQGPRPFMIDLFSYPKALPKKTAETAHNVTRGISQLRMVAETAQDIPLSIKEELSLAEEHFSIGARRLIRVAKARQEVKASDKNLHKAVHHAASARRNYAEAMGCTPASSKDTDEESPHPAPTRAPDPPRPPPGNYPPKWLR